MKKIIFTLSLILAIACVFTACDQFPWQPTEKDDEITVEGGYLVVSGVKTEYEVNTEDVIEVVDGYVVVNGVKTDIKADDGICDHTPEPDVIEVVDGYLVVNGEKTEHKVYSEPVISVIDGYVAINGVKTEYKVFADCEHAWETVTTEPTCTTEGYDTMTCLLCGKVVKTNMVEKHDYDTTYTIDDEYHWHTCKDCNTVGGKELHTLDEEGVCTVCDIPFSSTPGVIYDLSDDKTYAIVVGYTGSATKVKIAEEYNGVPVKSIYDYAFSDCSNLTSVVIPDSVTSIGYEAFYDCYILSSVVIGESVTYIGGNAFCGCFNLTSVVIPDSVTSIGDGAFDNCSTSLYSEYEFGKYVGSKDNPYFILVENTNKNMSTYTIHEDTKIIGGRVFSDCSRLYSITIPDSVTSISDGAFYSCDSLTSVVIPDSVTSIGDAAFYWCHNLASVVIPDSVTSIGDDAFENCSSLTSVVIGNSVTNIGNDAFHGCDSLTSVVIPDSVTSIGHSAFSHCDSLTSVVIGDSLTSIGEYAFSWCSRLTSVVIPDSVTSIGYAAFNDCSNLTDVYYTGSEEEWAKISIGEYNSDLTYANIYYNYVPEE